MKSFISSITLVIISIAILSACDDMLTKAPSDQPANISYYSNEQELESAVNGIYNIFWDLESRSLPIDMSLDHTADIGFLRSGHVKEISQGGHSATNSIIVATWVRLYSGVARVHNLLEYMDRADDASPEAKERFQAEARFLRAYFYYYLTELWGDVPLITEIPDLEEAEIGRTPKNEVVDQIIEDLDYAAEVLPRNWSGNNEGRATVGAALTLKARVALFNERFDLAANTAQQVMDLGEYSLYPDYETIFQYDGERNEEVIFDVPYQRGVKTNNVPFRQATRNANAVSTNVPNQFLVDSYIAADGLPIDESQVYDPRNPFENRDPRLDATIVRPQSVYAGYVFETHPDSTETWFIDGEDSRRVTNRDVTNPFATYTGYTWRKFTPEEDLPDFPTDSELNFIKMRLGEVLLIYAEAKIENNDIDQSVLDAINRIRARGFGADGVSDVNNYPEVNTTNQEELRKILRNERKVELVLEGFRLFDIRRWRIADKVMDGDLVGRPKGAYSEITSPPTIDDKTGHPDYGPLINQYRLPEIRSFNPGRDWLWPIPQSEMDANDNITQNPGY